MTRPYIRKQALCYFCYQPADEDATHYYDSEMGKHAVVHVACLNMQQEVLGV